MDGQSTHSRWHLGAAACAWLVPGLGHYLMGQRTRGIVLAVSIGLLWLMGLGIGGISVLDPTRFAQNIVGFGQLGMGPSCVGYFVNDQLRDRVLAVPKEAPLSDHPFEPSFGHENELGVLFTALAGMLNLLAVIDVAYRDPDDVRYQTELAEENAPRVEGGAA